MLPVATAATSSARAERNPGPAKARQLAPGGHEQRRRGAPRRAVPSRGESKVRSWRWPGSCSSSWSRSRPPRRRPSSSCPHRARPGTHATLVASQLPPRSEVELRVGNRTVKRLQANSAGIVTARERIPSTARGHVPISLHGRARRPRAAPVRRAVALGPSGRASRAPTGAAARGQRRGGPEARQAGRARGGQGPAAGGPCRGAVRRPARRRARSPAPQGDARRSAPSCPRRRTAPASWFQGHRLRLTATLPTPPATARGGRRHRLQGAVRDLRGPLRARRGRRARGEPQPRRDRASPATSSTSTAS